MRIARDAVPPRAAVSRHFRRVDPDQAHPLAIAAERVAIEAVGVPATFDICQKIVSAGGNIANVGVHGTPVQLHLEELWIKNINISMGLVSTNTTPMLLKTLNTGKVNPGKLVTHRFKLDEILEAYEVFGNAAREKAMKVILNA